MIVNTDEKLVSIIIPNYNKGQFISETLESIINQTYNRWEAIIVDDGSNDDSIDIIKSYQIKDNRFCLIERNREPKGGSVCRNIGIDNASGDFIIFLDSDDLIIPSMLENRLNSFKIYPDNDFLIFPTGVFYTKIGDNNSKIIPKKTEHLKYFLRNNFQWTVMSPIWKKDFLLKLNGYDEEYNKLEDIEFHIRALLEKNVKYYIIRNNHIDNFYRQSDARIVAKDYNHFFQQYVTATLLYFKKTSIIIKKSNLPNKSLYLRDLLGSLLICITAILDAYEDKKITENQKNKLINSLLDYNGSLNQLSTIDIVLIKLYIKGYEVRLHKIRGYKNISRKIILSKTMYYMNKIRRT